MIGTLETKIITELRDILKNNRTCKSNISLGCAETGSSSMFRWRTICIECERERARLYSKKWNAENYVKRCRSRSRSLPKTPKNPKKKPRRMRHIKLDPLMCDAISPVVYFGW